VSADRGPSRTKIALAGLAITVAIIVVGFVVVGGVSLGQCGFSSGSAEPGTLAAELCRDGTGRTMFLLITLGPLAIGAAATVRAAASVDPRRLRAPLGVAAAVPLGVAVLYAVSGSL
jgi:uncharacterized ferredoxin-like protein